MTRVLTGTTRAAVPAATLCPSTPGAPGHSVLIGVVTGVAGAARVTPVVPAAEVTDDLLALAAPVSPSEVFRFAAPCRACACTQFEGGACQLAARSVVELAEVTPALPACAIRPQCRWYQQEGAAMCRRCPQIVTEQYAPSEAMRRVVSS